jgi:hypothetical protein
VQQTGRNQFTGRNRTLMGITQLDRGRNGAASCRRGEAGGLCTAVASMPRLEPIRADSSARRPVECLQIAYWPGQSVVFSFRWSRRLIDLISTRRTWLSCSTSMATVVPAAPWAQTFR